MLQGLWLPAPAPAEAVPHFLRYEADDVREAITATSKLRPDQVSHLLGGCVRWPSVQANHTLLNHGTCCSAGQCGCPAVVMVFSNFVVFGRLRSCPPCTMTLTLQPLLFRKSTLSWLLTPYMPCIVVDSQPGFGIR